jgi:nicotinamide riboside kinase
MESCSIGEEKEATTNNNKLLRPPNIYLVGAQCTGKTTLLEALRTHFLDAKNREFHDRPTHLPAVIEEVVRGVMRRKGFTVTDITQPDRGLELQQSNLQAQFDAENALADRWFISDRSGLDAIVYANVYLGTAAAAKLTDLNEWSILRERMKEAVVIVCEAGNKA